MTSSKKPRKVETLYGYCDYADDGRPYYVGIGHARRVKIRARNKKHSLVSSKHGCNRRIEVTLSGDQIEIWQRLCEWEIATIKAYDTLHRPEHIGCNFTVGGDGIRGFTRVKSVEERRKLSESKTALYADPIERQKLGEAIRKAKQDPVKLQHHCDGQRKRYADPQEREKARVINTQKKRVQQLTLDGEVVAEYPSMTCAMQVTGVKNIKLVCQGKRPVAGGFRWRYN